MRRPLFVSLLAAALTFWIDGLVTFGGDAGPVGWGLSMAIPQLFLLPGLLAALWALRKRDRIAAAVGGGVALSQILGPMGLCFGRAASGPADLRVVSYNIGQFESGRWPEPTVTAVAETLKGLDPDVACLQEAHYHGRDRFGDMLAAQMPGYHALREGGMLLLSKRPFLRHETHVFPSHLGGHWNVQEVALGVDEREMRFLNVHMLPDAYEPGWWPKLSFLDAVERKRRLRNEEMDEVVRRVGAKAGPIVVCGDFNSQPFDPRVRRLAGIMTDAFRATSTGFGYTLTSKAPTKRIDYVWTRGLRPLRTRVVDSPHSDHLPLLAELAFPR